MYINSPGGSVYAGLAIYDTVQYIKPDVQTICCGVAMSMGALLLAGGANGKRMALPNSKILIHQVLGRLPGPGRRHRDPCQGDHRRPPAPRRDHRQAHRAPGREGRQGHRARLLHERRGGQGVQHRRPCDRAPLARSGPGALPAASQAAARWALQRSLPVSQLVAPRVEVAADADHAVGPLSVPSEPAADLRDHHAARRVRPAGPVEPSVSDPHPPREAAVGLAPSLAAAHVELIPGEPDRHPLGAAMPELRFEADCSAVPIASLKVGNSGRRGSGNRQRDDHPCANHRSLHPAAPSLARLPCR